MFVPVEKVDATKKLPHEVFDPVRSQTRYRTSLQVHCQVLKQVHWFRSVPYYKNTVRVLGNLEPVQLGPTAHGPICPEPTGKS